MPAGCPICDNCNPDVGGEPDALKGASPVRRGAEGRSLRDATRPTLRLPERFRPEPVSLPEPTARDRELDTFFAAIPASLHHGGSEAYYMPSTDQITMPEVSQFRTRDLYRSTLAHELAHWTGHRSRLDRSLGGRFGSDAYAVEELVAELASAMIGAELGLPVDHLDDHASYLGSWLKVLKTDARAILTAAAKAEEASAYLLKLGRAERPAEVSLAA